MDRVGDHVDSASVPAAAAVGSCEPEPVEVTPSLPDVGATAEPSGRADTLAEDMDLTWRLRRDGWTVRNEPDALGYTEVCIRNISSRQAEALATMKAKLP